MTTPRALDAAAAGLTAATVTAAAVIADAPWWLPAIGVAYAAAGFGTAAALVYSHADRYAAAQRARGAARGTTAERVA
jgi:hypothetical protein